MPLKRFFAGLSASGRDEVSAEAERPLLALLVASLVLPAILFLIAATISY